MSESREMLLQSYKFPKPFKGPQLPPRIMGYY